MNNLNPLIMFPYNQQYGAPYYYVAKFPALPASQQQSIPVEIDASFVFKWQSLTFDRWSAAGAQVLNDELLIQITDSRSSRNFFDSPIPLALLCGNGDAFIGEYILPIPHLFDPSCVIQVTVTNTALAGNCQLDIVFGGIKIPVSEQGFGI